MAGVPATEKQMGYLRKLCTQTDTDIHTFLVERGITELKGFPTAVVVARVPSKTEASALIDALKATAGIEVRAYAPRGRSRRYGSSYTRFSSGAEVWVNRNGRCEDAPCCGCCS